MTTKLACNNCGIKYKKDACFCLGCGTSFLSQQQQNISINAGINAIQLKSHFVRRFLAEIVDRLVPLPFVAYFFPHWIIVVVLYHLLCDGMHSGQSLGKWLFRLRTVSTVMLQPSNWLQSIIRRFNSTICQVAYCLFIFHPLVIAYELVSIVFILLNPAGRSMEDYLAGTQVITEKEYKKSYHNCPDCQQKVFVWAKYCQNCGKQIERKG